MAEYDNSNRGVLFKNNRKEEGDKKPEYTGSLNVGGVEYFLDAWVKKSQAGQSFMSVSIKRKDKQQEPQQQAPARREPGRRPAPAPVGGSGFDDMDDSIPF